MTGAAVIIRGRVQGVAFRHHTRQKALELGVTGWVRNRPDGSVEGLFEGSDAAVAALIEWCRSGPPAAHVEGIEFREQTASGGFTGFSISA